MTDKRRIRRKELIFYLKVYERSTNELVGHLTDISTKGMKLISKDPVLVDKTYQFKTVLAKKTDVGDTLSFDAHSVWCRKDTHLSDFFDVGFQFIHMQPGDLHKLEEWFREAWFKVE